MPFTLSHPAAVLPLIARRRGPLIASALVAGSLAPDVPYFTESLVHGTYGYGAATHAAWGVPTVDVLLAAALVGFWHGLLRAPLVALLPRRLAGRAEALTARRRRWWPVRAADVGWFVLSAALGAATHVGWDSFTHHDRFGVRLLPVLNRTVAGEPLFSLLQYGSSALALLYVGRFVHRALRSTEPVPLAPLPYRRRTALVGIAAAALLGTLFRIADRARLRLPLASPLELIPTVAFGSIAGLTVGLTLHALAARLSRLSRRPA
ncbi:hypothetical protein GCM10010441_04860 [Kitasatospora paracochleata]|uniref:DUF4184 family protein n=1 Tax=Kitasatospora paracochleata TaxID=58354 RepID=A0ABT1J8P9_9ACTN|nr:DUF4184 family protein [Kitasatospora paracochleata]MCP2313815.1 hypothetical protein [Kitasatospora paracochleata]